jgi:hypothetical protein
MYSLALLCGMDSNTVDLILQIYEVLLVVSKYYMLQYRRVFLPTIVEFNEIRISVCM